MYRYLPLPLLIACGPPSGTTWTDVNHLIVLWAPAGTRIELSGDGEMLFAETLPTDVMLWERSVEALWWRSEVDVQFSNTSCGMLLPLAWSSTEREFITLEQTSPCSYVMPLH